jgi:hypothetical protein
MLTSAFSVGLVWMNVLFVCWWDYYGTDSDIIVDLWEKGEDSVFRGAPHLVILTGPRGMGNIMWAGKRTPSAWLTLNSQPFRIILVPSGQGSSWRLSSYGLPHAKPSDSRRGRRPWTPCASAIPRICIGEYHRGMNLESLCDNCYLRELRPKLKS